jgi:hypothetical protein
MKRTPALLFLLLIFAATVPAKAQIFRGPDANRQAQKAAKKNQKTANKLARKQAKTMRKAAKRQQKAMRRAANSHPRS